MTNAGRNMAKHEEAPSFSSARIQSHNGSIHSPHRIRNIIMNEWKKSLKFHLESNFVWGLRIDRKSGRSCGSTEKFGIKWIYLSNVPVLVIKNCPEILENAFKNTLQRNAVPNTVAIINVWKLIFSTVFCIEMSESDFSRKIGIKLSGNDFFLIHKLL